MITKLWNSKRIFTFLMIFCAGSQNIFAKSIEQDKKPIEGTQQPPIITIPANFELDLSDPISSLRNARDSYGNPLPSFNSNNGKPKNGDRKVVEANGYLFEIPSYASGITDIKPPSDELLPPLVSEEQDESTPAQFDQPYLDLLPPLPGEPDNTTLTDPKDESANEIKNTQSSKTTNEPASTSPKQNQLTKPYPSTSSFPAKTSPTYGGQQTTPNQPGFPSKQPNYQQQPKIPTTPPNQPPFPRQNQPSKGFPTSPFASNQPTAYPGQPTFPSKQPNYQQQAQPTSSFGNPSLTTYQKQPTSPGLSSNFSSTAQPNFQQQNPPSKQKPPIRFEDFLKGPLSSQNQPQGPSLLPNRFDKPSQQQTPNVFQSPNSLGTKEQLQAPKDNGDLTYFLWFVKNKDKILNTGNYDE